MILFILSIEKECRIKGIKCANDLRVSVLVYANNTTIILNPDSDLTALLKLFATFKRASNTMINMTKSVLIIISRVIAREIEFYRLQKEELIKLLSFLLSKLVYSLQKSFGERK
jgi:hypothetical protein